MNRRQFLQLGALGTGATLAGITPLQGQPVPADTAVKKSTMIAMPISIAPLAQPDLDTIFADMRDRAGVNALFPFIYSHESHRAGVPSDHFHGGNYARPHMQYYKDTPLTEADMTAPEFGGVDILERVIPIAAKHGIRVFGFLLEDNGLPDPVKADWQSLYEVDHHGRRTTGHPGGPCFNNPGYQNFTLGLVEDYA